MNCFLDPITTIYIRDVSQTMNTINLQEMNLKGKHKLERVSLRTETLSHEMRTPLSNIVVIMEALLHMLTRPPNISQMKR